MAALTLALVVLGALELKLDGCDAAIDGAALKKLVQLEWADPPPETRATLACSGAQVRLMLEAPGLLATDEQLELPALSGAARTRVLALIVAERGRAFTNAPPAAPPEPAPPAPPLVELLREPAKPRTEVVEVRVATPQEGSALRDGLVVLGSAPPSRRWRLAIGAAAVGPTTLAPWRFGPEVRIHGGPFAVTLTSTVGTLRADLGTVTALAVTAEPEVTLACIGARLFRACAAARGVAGYGAISATTTVAEVSATRQDGPLLGGAGVLSASLELLSWLSLDADARIGWAWGVYGSQSGSALATVGGGFFAAALGLAASWGSP